MARFREMGITPATRHGQNFLIDLNLQQIIVDAAELTDGRRGARNRHRHRGADGA